MSPLLQLVIQRVALGLVLLLAVSVVIFVGTEALPGDVASAILGQSATPEALANLRAELGLDAPAITRDANSEPTISPFSDAMPSPARNPQIAPVDGSVRSAAHSASASRKSGCPPQK